MTLRIDTDSATVTTHFKHLDTPTWGNEKNYNYWSLTWINRERLHRQQGALAIL